MQAQLVHGNSSDQLTGLVEVLNELDYILFETKVVRIPCASGYKDGIIVAHFDLVCRAIEFDPAYRLEIPSKLTTSFRGKVTT